MQILEAAGSRGAALPPAAAAGTAAAAAAASTSSSDCCPATGGGAPGLQELMLSDSFESGGDWGADLVQRIRRALRRASMMITHLCLHHCRLADDEGATRRRKESLGRGNLRSGASTCLSVVACGGGSWLRLLASSLVCFSQPRSPSL